ncbi:4-hydroxy-3-methylbut-2-enyl diphosphate reductase [Phreatobacter sp.]|uniref:4-hydroxy-3-methylbut-2-enyl diphosphate reductase n=1 Tax=Phreatobacter sp. TaxID=1966341 RepID=UPI0022C8FD2D|nr:4-hydroxy-3-methylbut-2-enyl diphosphate reductase [Phreatobacter sp.]MCZ8315471.1 4-hydroxy-3-methylbut-2-enyl diphosphate reductase [Phreatobacter sp.]
MPLREELTVVLANPRGFCAGVVRAIEIVERAIALHGAPVYVRHEIVHNRHVVARLRRQGAIFVESLEEVPAGAVTVFSAHGVSQAVEEEARERGLSVIDATCPLVTKVHRQGRRYAEKGFSVVLIGHEGHAEVEGTRGQVPGGVTVVGSADEVASLAIADPSRVAYVTQTTLSVDDTREVVDAVKARFPAAVGPELDDICYATQNRQTAVTMMVEDVDLLIVLGSANSSNSNRLREIGVKAGIPAHLVDDASEVDPRWLDGIRRVGVTAGASAPEDLVRGLIDRLSTLRTVTVESVGDVHETVEFRLPTALTAAAREREPAPAAALQTGSL